MDVITGKTNSLLIVLKINIDNRILKLLSIFKT